MTGVLVGLLAVLWALVLVPPLMRTRDYDSLSVGSFSRGMKALGSNYGDRAMGGRYVLTPKTQLDEPDPRLLIFRRRRNFSAMVAGLLITSILGLVPIFRMVWWASLLFALAVIGYAAYLITERSRTVAYHRPLSAPRDQRDRQFAAMGAGMTPPMSESVHVLSAEPRAFFNAFEDDEVDDGLSELGWARAGRL